MNTSNFVDASTLRDEARAALARAEESFQRCDTDGFLSQWAHTVTAEKLNLLAELTEAGGVWDFPGLFDLEGNRLAAKLINAKHGMCWALMDAHDNLSGEFVTFIGYPPHPYNYGRTEEEGAASAEFKRMMRGYERKIANLAKKGYVEATEQVPARVLLRGSSATNVRAIIERTDGGYPPGAKVVVNSVEHF